VNEAIFVGDLWPWGATAFRYCVRYSYVGCRIYELQPFRNSFAADTGL